MTRPTYYRHKKAGTGPFVPSETAPLSVETGCSAIKLSDSRGRTCLTEQAEMPQKESSGPRSPKLQSTPEIQCQRQVRVTVAK